MLFAAGWGTRLRPHTNHRPKALVMVAGQTLLERNLRQLSRAGCTEVVVNVHAFADQMEDFIDREWRATATFLAPDSDGKDKEYPRARVIVSDERGQLLETGGGMLLARPWLEKEDFLVHNVDILSGIDLQDLMRYHREKKGLVTLCVRHRETSRYLLFDRETRALRGWRNVKTGAEKPARPFTEATVEALAYSGVAVYSPRFFTHMEGREGEKFSVVDVWLRAAATQSLYAYPHDETSWIDVGRPESLELAEKMWLKS